MFEGGGACNTTLRYEPTRSEGSANLTADYFQVITDVENYAQCCAICANTPECVSWTRVAGMPLSLLANTPTCHYHPPDLEASRSARHPLPSWLCCKALLLTCCSLRVQAEIRRC